jgi:hypothetical protein
VRFPIFFRLPDRCTAVSCIARYACGAVLGVLAFAAPIAQSGNRDPAKEEGERAYFQVRGYDSLHIAREELPRRGHCRVWYPDKPLGEQPSQGKCSVVSRQVPPGAWLMARPTSDPGHVNVHVFDDQVPGVVKAIGVFSIETLQFVRYLSP